MNLLMLDDRLSSAISRYGRMALESRQVARRLAALLPSRFLELRRAHASSQGRRVAKAERAAYVDPRYLAFVDELAAVTGEAAAARVQYETHAMLFQARQSLRKSRR